MIAVVLYQPEIPPNTGNIIRLCANTGAELHLVEPLGFEFTDKALRRAGLDYHECARVIRHAGWQACRAALGQRRLWAMTTRGSASPFASELGDDDAFVFGCETAGLPAEMLAQFPNNLVRVPMRPQVRSLNLAVTAGIAIYEAVRQIGVSDEHFA